MDSGCTNHMTHDQEFSESWTYHRYQKLESEQLVEIDQNLLSVGQLVEKGFKVIFENKHCLIKDVNDKEISSIKKRGKSFSFDPLKEEQVAYPATVNSTEAWPKG